MKRSVLKEILILTKVYTDSTLELQGSFFGLGAGYGKNQVITVPALSETQLFSYFQTLVGEIISLGFSGVFLHIDNFEKTANEDPKKVQLFFHKIRDVLQTPDVYFAFIGYPGFYKQIIFPVERVRSIFFNLPIFLTPLTKNQILEAIIKRYELLATDKFTKPVEDEFIAYLYCLYEGKIRSIFDSLSTLLVNFPFGIKPPLKKEEAQKILQEEVQDRISSVLSNKSVSVLWKIAKEVECTASEIARKLKDARQNISPIFKQLEELHFIYTSKRNGKKVFYKINESLKIMGETVVHPSPNLNPSEVQKMFLDMLNRKNKLTLKEFCAVANIQPNYARKKINELVENGMVEKYGFTHGLHYMIPAKEK